MREAINSDGDGPGIIGAGPGEAPPIFLTHVRPGHSTSAGGARHHALDAVTEILAEAARSRPLATVGD